MKFSLPWQQSSQLGVNLDRVLRSFKDKNHVDDNFFVRDLFEHCFIAGSTGAGKTSTLGYYLAKSILQVEKLPEQEKIGMVVFLYKASDLALWQSWCEEHHRLDDMIVIGDDGSYAFNLLEYYKDKEVISAVDALMNLSGLSLGGSSQKESEHYWEQAKRQRLHRLILLNQLSGEPLNISTLYKLHSSSPQYGEQLQDKIFLGQSYCLQMLGKAADRMGEDHPQFQLVEDYFLREMPYMADRTQSSILSLTSAILEPFISSPLLNKLFCQDTTLSLDHLLTGKIVILNLPIQQWEFSGKLAQMLFKYVLQKRIESRNLQELPNPVCFWLDEFQHYISAYDALFLSTARSARAGCILLTQNISSLYAQIGGNGRMAEEKVNALLSLTNHKFFMAQNSYITNEFASKTIGLGIRNLHSTTASFQSRGLEGSAGISEQYQYQIMPKEFTMLKRGGKHHQGVVEVYLTATGKIFSNGKNYLKLRLQQPWYGK